MSDSTEQKAMSLWQKPQVQALVQHALGSSGVIGIGLVKLCHWAGVPAPDLGTVSEFAMAGVPLVGSAAFSWWHNHPNNLAARVIRQINGDAVSSDAKKAVAEAVKTTKEGP